MEDELIHELSAGYAANALTQAEERRYEQHLATCPRCRAEVSELAEAAAALAFASPPERAPAALRGRIVDAARRERESVSVRRPRWAYPAVALASVACCAALGLGVWAALLHSRLDTGEAVRALPLARGTGSLVVGRRGEAVLVLAGLPPAPAGRTYEAWVVRSGGAAAEPAGVFASRPGTTTIRLARRVSHGARVSVTVEPSGGSEHPTSRPLVVSQRA